MDSSFKKRTKKRRRTVITPEEIEKLEESFNKEPKPDRGAKLELAKELTKTENFINIWFQNRRAKERKMIKNPTDNTDPINLSTKSSQDGKTSSSTVIDTPPLFRRMVMMAAASEGGILPLNCADVSRAITDSYKGIRLRDGIVHYSKEAGFELIEEME